MSANVQCSWEIELVFLDIFIGFSDSLVLIGRLPNEQGVHDDPNGPNIHLVGMALLFDDFRRDIVGSAAQSFLEVPLMLDDGREPEVADFELHF